MFPEVFTRFIERLQKNVQESSQSEYVGEKKHVKSDE